MDIGACKLLLKNLVGWYRWVEKKDWAQALFIAVKEAGPFKVSSF